ncbi:Site-specific DNA recombinase [Thermoactinomyces sp. DSM 45891]|uniref:recombinase family protein n=1 Tax=Thermoactinomyces sp. DSM 45891 TaxID=1761907 RepID=UPI00091F42B9|nr:recombinase family protein [Thermoactinomyces sp. DSM 45891]SFX33196.1 Site-specific DNA recombinase [Thermoactinomyces sp. DSM 45891]
MLIGYMRPYQNDIQCKQQQDILIKTQCETFILEEHATAKNRVKLVEMIDNLDSGDKIVVTKLFALADSTRHLMELLEVIEAKGAFIWSIFEDIDTSHRPKHTLSDMVKHLVTFQSDMISEKTKQGLHEAKQKGVTSGRPKKPDENVQRAIQMYQSKNYSLDEIKRETGISKSTLYRYMES